MGQTEEVAIRIALKDELSRGLQSIQDRLIGIGAAWLTWDAAKTVLTGIFSDSAKLQGQMVTLRAAVERAGISWRDNSGQIDKFTQQMTNQKGVIDDYTREVLPRALDYTKNLADAETIVSAAADLSAGAHMDLWTATNLLGKAYKGHTETLARYGIEIKNSSDAVGNAKYIQEQINTQFNGAAAATLGTITKKWELLKDAVEDVNEALGRRLGADKEGGGAIGKSLETATTAVSGMAWAIDNPGSGLAAILSQLVIKAGLTDRGMESLGRSMNNLSMAEMEAALHGRSLTDSVEDVGKAVQQTTIWTKDMLDQVSSVLTGNKGFLDYAVGSSSDWAEHTKQAKALNVELEYLRNLMSHYGKIGSDAEASLQAMSNAMIVGAEEVDKAQALTVTRQITRTTNANARVLASHNSLRKAIMAGFEDAIPASLDRGVSSMLDSMHWLNEETTGVFKQMAQDFVRYFIQACMSSLIMDLVGSLGGGGILGILGSIFDTPANDRMAARQGADYMRHFTNGATEYAYGFNPANAFRLGQLNTGSVAAGGTNAQYYGQQDRGNNITIYISGMASAAEAALAVARALKSDSVRGFNKISIKNATFTGGPALAGA